MNRMNSEIEEVNDGNMLFPVVTEARIRAELPRQPEGTTMVAEILGKPYWKKNTKLNIMEWTRIRKWAVDMGGHFKQEDNMRRSAGQV